MNFPSELVYTKTHEWVRRLPAAPPGAAQAGEATEVTVGITAHAQEELRDIVFVELPKIGRTIKQGEPAAVIESVKAAFDIYAPISGTVARINDAVAKSPQIVNQDCYGAGWLFTITPSNPKEFSGLMAADAYTNQLKAETHER